MVATLAKPLSKDEALRRLRALEPQMREMGIVSLYLFGSTVRDEAGSDSDVDLFGDLEPGRVFGWEYASLGGRIADHLGQRVDFIARDSLHPMLTERIQASAERIF